MRMVRGEHIRPFSKTSTPAHKPRNSLVGHELRLRLPLPHCDELPRLPQLLHGLLPRGSLQLRERRPPLPPVLQSP